MASESATPAAATDLISFLKALPDCRMRRGIRFPQWWMLMVAILSIQVDHGRDITWTLRSMPAPEWVVENWPGSATVIAVRSKGIRDGKPTDETRY